MKDRIELAKYFAELGFKIGAEIGVYAGRYSRQLLDNISGLKLYSIDSWLGKYTRHEEKARQSLLKYPGSTIIKGMSVDAAKTISDNSLDFVYIDANHFYACVMDDMTAWTPKVRSGGIVSGHDYQLPEVRKAVDEYTTQHNYKLNVTEESISSWWFVKK